MKLMERLATDCRTKPSGAIGRTAGHSYVRKRVSSSHLLKKGTVSKLRLKETTYESCERQREKQANHATGIRFVGCVVRSKSPRHPGIRNVYGLLWPAKFHLTLPAILTKHLARYGGRQLQTPNEMRGK